MRWKRALVDEPHGLDWAIAWSFMVGAALFALGSFPVYSLLVGAGVVGSTFVAGSVSFTAAAYGQFVQACSAGADDGWRLIGLRPSSRLWWAAVVQLVGTILFNINTVRATVDGLTAEEANRLVWAPDTFGSIAFLVASHLAWTVVCGGLWRVRSDDAEWWSAALNYGGSIFFMVSAIASFTLPSTDTVLNATVVNIATFLGSMGFLVGAYLLLPPVPTDARPHHADVT